MKLIGVILGVGAIASVVLGIYWLLWLLWMWVLPQLWPTGPDSLINPGFWLFTACWFLIALLGKSIFGSSGK